MIKIIRTNSKHPDFINLVHYLDQELAERDGADHSFYAQYNAITNLDYVILLYQNQDAIACGAFKVFEKESVEIKRMFTNPKQRGHRYAQQVLHALENWAKEEGFLTAVLETGKKQPEAIRLYQKCGYQIIPNYGQYQGIENSICFQKKLADGK
jgi:putative acetyltransferase